MARGSKLVKNLQIIFAIYCNSWISSAMAMATSILTAAKDCQRLQKIDKGSKKLPKVVKSCQKLPKVSKSCHKLSKNSKTCQKVPKHWLHLAPLGQAGSVCLRLATNQSVKNTQIYTCMDGIGLVGSLNHLTTRAPLTERC